LLFITLAFVGYGVQSSRLRVEALNATTTSSIQDDTVPLIPLLTLIPLAVALMAGLVRLRQAVVIGNAKVEDGVSLPPEEEAQGVKQFELAVSRSVASSSDANIVCGYILYNIVTFGTDIGSLDQSSDPQQLSVVVAFLTVNVAACGLALLSVMLGLFIKVRDARLTFEMLCACFNLFSVTDTRRSRCGAA
jgi:hypothetical protein